MTFTKGVRYVCALAVASALCLSTASSVPAAPPVLRLGPQRVRRAQAFWTAARLRKAKPIAPPPLPSSSSGYRLTGEQESSAVVPDPTTPEFRQNGAIFISEGPHRGFGRCSGTAVTAPNLSVVFTAGHCVFDRGHWWARHWVFVPAYRYGERPFGTFAAKWLGTTPGWRNHQNSNFDVGVAVVGRNERGQRLQAAVGADKIAFDLSPHQLFDVYGYPVAQPFNGSTLRVCDEAQYLGHVLEAWLTPGPLQLGVTCRVSPGSSGGGWVIDGDTLDGVTTDSYPEDPYTDYGPYFGHAVEQLYARAARVR